ncbi:MAG: hypothetical protein RL318_2586 [Fibrobacterota bacterium]|jgi:hypothetical protein
MIRRNLALSLLLIALGLGGCAQIDSGSPVATGPGSETSGLQGFKIQLRNAKGEPVRKTEVQVVAVEGWSDHVISGSAVIDRQTTDDSGRVEFDNLPKIRLSLEANLGSAVVRKELAAGSATQQTLVLQNGGMVLVRLKGDTSGIRKLMLAGTGLEAQRQSDGWVFSWVPVGSYDLIAWRNGVITPIARVSADSLRMLDTTLKVQATTFLDDFDAPSLQNLFGTKLAGGYWFASGEGWQGGMNPISNPDLISAREPGWQAKSLHVQFQVDTTSPTNYAMLNMDLAGGGTAGFGPLRNVSTLDTVVFTARGRGTVVFQLLGAPGCVWSADVALTGAWARIALPSSALQPSGANCVDWHVSAPSVRGLAFRTTRDAELWLDNLELKGVNPGILFPELH